MLEVRKILSADYLREAVFSRSARNKIFPLDTELARSLRLWKMKTIYNRPNDWTSPSLSASLHAALPPKYAATILVTCEIAAIAPI